MTKAEIEQQLKQCQQELLTLKKEHKQLQRILTLALHAVQLKKEDPERALEPVTLCDEVGSERAERYKQSLEHATERLSTLWSALSSGQTLDFLDPLWQITPGEDERLSEYLQQSTESIQEDLAQ